MASDQWNEIKRIFTKAMNLEGAGRKAYLNRACHTQRIRRDVDSLLVQHDKAGDFPGVYSSLENRTLAHYEISERIGEGGMAVVYKARDTILDRWVALKVLQPWAMTSAASQERLIAEARAASALNHPNIVTVHEMVNVDSVRFIVMEYVAGKTLDQWIPPDGMPIVDALDFAGQIADALSTAHADGIVHGDLKPFNVVITDTGRVKVLDFGLARILRTRGAKSKGSSAQMTAFGQFGTKAYMAPEQLRNHRTAADPRSDIFSFGLILHTMLTGSHPFGHGTREQLAHAIQNKSPAAVPKAVPVSLRRIVARCLEKDPERRFRSMSDVHAALIMAESTRPLGRHARPTLEPSSSGTGLEISAILGRIGFENIPQGREALRELASALQIEHSKQACQTAISALKGLIQRDVDRPGGVIPSSIRELRKAALEVLKIATQGHLSTCFGPRDLEYLDLYGMNFVREQLNEFSFNGCFLVEADFRKSCLRSASFAKACLRNANFLSADLAGVDLTGADWFNALNLTEAQLRSVRKETVLLCPTGLQAMYEYVASRYVVPFDAWPAHIQEQLKRAWRRYLRPNGLGDVVASWRK